MSDSSEEDHNLKMIERFATVLTEISQNRQEKKYNDAFQKIVVVSTKYLKLNLETLLNFSPKQIQEQFKDHSYMCVSCADLIYEMALLSESQQFSKESLKMKTTCLILLASTAQYLNKDHLLKIEKLTKDVNLENLAKEDALKVKEILQTIP